MKARLTLGFESRALLKGKTMASTGGWASGRILLIKSAGRRFSTLDMDIPRRVSGLSEPYIAIAAW